MNLANASAAVFRMHLLAAGLGLIATLHAGCGNSAPSGAAVYRSQEHVEISRDIPATAFSSGYVTTWQATEHNSSSLIVNLDIPDNSPVLNYKSPTADIEIRCAKSVQEVNGILCQLNVSGGKRSFWFKQSLTDEQQSSFQTVKVLQVYDRPSDNGKSTWSNRMAEDIMQKIK